MLINFLGLYKNMNSICHSSLLFYNLIVLNLLNNFIKAILDSKSAKCFPKQLLGPALKFHKV